jgi:hypothetical protein
MTVASPNFPDDCVQSVCATWWIADSTQGLCRGRLIRTFIPHIDQQPHVLSAQGRASATAHGQALFSMAPFNMKSPPPQPALPVAAITHPAGERQFVYRGKVRPALVLALEADDIERQLVSGAARWQTAKTILVAPYYGADQGGTRGGWSPLFVQRIRRAYYPQYMCDRLPIGGSEESIMRFDQVQAIGPDRPAIEILPWKLSDEALSFVDEWLTWYVRRELLEGGPLHLVREMLVKL